MFKTYFLISILPLVAFFCHAQIPQSPNVLDSNGQRQGRWTILFDIDWNETEEPENAAFYRIADFDQGKPVGKITDYYENGIPQMEADSIVSELPEKYDGKVILYSQEGNITGLEFYNEGMLNLEKSIQLFETIIQSQTLEIPDSPDRAIAINRLATLYHSSSNLDKSEELFKQSKQIYTQLVDNKDFIYANIINGLAILYEEQALYTLAEPLFVEIKDIIESYVGNQDVNYAIACQNLATLYKNQSLFSKAEAIYLEVIKIHQNTLGRENPHSAQAIQNLAVLYLELGYYKKAELLFLEAKEIIEKYNGKKHPDFATVCTNLAVVYSYLDKFSKSEHLLLEAKDNRILSSGLNSIEYANSLNNLANLYFKQGQFKKAEQFFINSEIITQKVLGENHPEYANVLNNLAYLYQTQKYYQKADSIITRAQQIYLNTYGKNNPKYALYLQNMSGVYLGQGLYQKAKSLLMEAIEIQVAMLGKNHYDYVISLNRLARVYTAQKKYDKSEQLYLESIPILHKSLGKNHSQYTTAVNDLAKLYEKQGKYQKAKLLYQETSQIFTKKTQTGFSHLSEKEKAQFFNTFKTSFEYYNTFTLKAYPEDPSLLSWVYDNALNIKGLLFQSTRKMRQRILNSKDTSLINKLENWQNKRDYLAHVYNLSESKRQKQGIDITKLEENINTLEKELSYSASTLPGLQNLDDLLGNKNQYTWKDVRGKLRPSEAAIEIIRIQNFENQLKDSLIYMALIVKHNSENHPDIVILPNGNELENKFFYNHRNALQYRREDQYSYQNYWQKIAQKLVGIKKVYFSAEGIYHQLNLNTLKNPKTGKYLLEEIDIQQVGSTKNLLTERIIPQNNHQALLLGRPMYDLEVSNHQKASKNYKPERGINQRVLSMSEFIAELNFKDLPGTEQEVRNIHKLLQSNNWSSQLFIKENALEEVVKDAQNPAVIHLATHGFFIEETQEFVPSFEDSNDNLNLDIDLNNLSQPISLTPDIINNQPDDSKSMLHSGVVLAGVSTYAKHSQKYDAEDGILTAYEAMNLNLDHTELLVLSACETGKGNIRYGEGVYGLQRGFMTAGVRCILMSLWNVDDIATQELMTIFYQNWMEGKSKREAFKIAQLAIKDKYKHPYYWGAFVMIGE